MEMQSLMSHYLHEMYSFHALPFTENPEGPEEDPHSISVLHKDVDLYIDGDPCGALAALRFTTEDHAENSYIR